MFNFLEDVDLKKEKERKRKKIYGEELRLQIEQNKRRKMEEKIKSRQESIRNLQLFKNNSSNNYNNTLFNKGIMEDNYFNNYNSNYHALKTSLDEPLFNYNLNDNYLSLSNKKNAFNDYTYNNINNYHNNTLLNNSIKRNLNNFYKSSDFNLNEKKNNNFNNIFNYHNNNNNSNINNNNIFNDNKMNRQNSFLENGLFIMKKSPSSFLNTNNYNNLISKNDDGFYNTINNNNFRYRNNIINDSKNNYFSHSANNNALMAEINLQFLFREFVEQQIKTINNYESNIEDIFYLQYKNSPITEPINTLLEKEKNIAIQTIRDEQNKLKSKLGFFPMENNYNFKIEQLFNKILNKKLATYSSIKEIDNLALNNLYNKQKEDDDEYNLLRYKSKYEDEDIQDSVPNFNNLDASSQNTLRGYSKLVKIKNEDNSINHNYDNDNNNNNEQKDEPNFLESWRDQLRKDIGENKKDSIKLRNNNNKRKMNDNDNDDDDYWEKNEDLKINNNDSLEQNKNKNRIVNNIETFPANQIFKNIQNIDIKNKRSNNIHNNMNNNKRESKISNIFDKNKISSNSSNISDKNNINSNIPENLIYEKDNTKNNLKSSKNLFIPKKIKSIDGRKIKSAYNIFKPDIISSNNLSTYKREYLSQKNNKINIDLSPREFEKEDKPQMHENKISNKTELNINNLKGLKSKNSFSFKNTDSSLVKNIEKGNFPFSNNSLKHYNYFSSNQNENKDEEKDSEKI